MAIDPKELQRHLDDLAREGITSDKFICPITFQQVPVEALRDGHILNDAFTDASPKTVIQFRDVDHYYGHTIEPVLIDYLNLPTLTDEEVINKAHRSAYLVNDKGEKFETFTVKSQKSKEQAEKKFPSFTINGKTGSFKRFVKAPIDKLTSDVALVATLKYNEPAAIGSFLKSAYLLMFLKSGYRFVNDPNGRTLRKPLVDFYNNKGTVATAGHYFGRFRGCVTIDEHDRLYNLVGDSINDNSFLFHSMDTGVGRNMFFAVSCLFRINDRTFLVTVPAHLDEGNWAVALSRYFEFLNDRSKRHTTNYAILEGEWFFDPRPINTQFDPNIGPLNYEVVAKQLKP